MCIKNLLAKRRFFCCVRKMGVLGIAETGERRPLQDKTPSKANTKSKKYVLHPVSVGIRPTPAPPIIQRACRQCVHESARLSRVICSHAWVVCSHGGQQNRRLSIYPLPHALATPWLARLTRARRGGLEGGRRESSLLTFAPLLVIQKRDKRKVSSC